MIKNLVIVESPAKAKTIEKFLGKDYKVMSSQGHIRDLSRGDLTIGPDGRFEPVYEVSEGKEELVKALKKEAAKADMVWLASDEDREGEAIAWHLYEVLNLKPEKTRRIVFHEITKDAILNAIANPRDIDIDLVNAQQARRVLDRIVGFELSPVLWRKIRPSLSAGRVQSVAVRLIVERENEIRNFTPEPYFKVTSMMKTPDGTPFRSELPHRLTDAQAVKTFLNNCAGATFTVSDINERPLKKNPAPPFTTSTLQQEASRKLGFSVNRTMSIAQRLYEAGHITYMRTDSLNLSTLAINAISKEIKATLGEEYLKVRKYHTSSKGAQEAHEAIRPTYINKREIAGSTEEQRLYDLIWKRAVASQMADAQLLKTTVEIQGSSLDDHFTASGEVVKFDGFLRVYKESTDTDQSEPDGTLLPHMKQGDPIDVLSVTAHERYTLAPPRYTEASLVKKMEELGIGRPSTYAPTIQTILDREYVKRGDRPGKEREFDIYTLVGGKINHIRETETVGSDKGKLVPTDTGMVTNDFLSQNFANILDYNFTANVEERFDQIAEGDAEWHNEISTFYDVFHPEVERASDMRLEHRVGERLLGPDPVSGKPVYVKIGRYGPVAQIGDSSDTLKPRFASLGSNQSIFDITLEEALKLFELPRVLGQWEGDDVILASGRFGPYVKHGATNASIPRDEQADEVTLERAIELITARRESNSNRTVKTFDEDPDMKILNGRYGVYIAYKNKNYRIPSSVADPTQLTLDECLALVKKQDEKRPARRTTTRKRTR